MARQLALKIQLSDTATFKNFYSAHNQGVVQHLQNLLAAQGYPIIYLWGSPGSGKSHLLQACCHAAQQQQLTVSYLPLLEHADWQPAIFDNLEQFDLVCLDDIEQLAGQGIWEEACFNLYNRMQANNHRLVITADKPPRDLALGLPDLISRLSAALILKIQPLNDQQKLNAIRLRAEHRGLILADEVAQFLLARCNRNMQTLFLLLEQLDQASLIAKRRLTIPFVKEVLAL